VAEVEKNVDGRRVTVEGEDDPVETTECDLPIFLVLRESSNIVSRS
jgi:hypothetical protein